MLTLDEFSLACDCGQASAGIGERVALPSGAHAVVTVRLSARDGESHPVTVRLGRQHGARQVVLEGLKQGQQVATSGQSRLAEGRAVEIRAEAASGAQRRMTADDVIARRVAMLRKGAPLLDAAFDALDLRLIE